MSYHRGFPIGRVPATFTSREYLLKGNRINPAEKFLFSNCVCQADSFNASPRNHVTTSRVYSKQLLILKKIEE